MEQRRFKGLENQSCAGFLVAFQALYYFVYLAGSMDISGTAACDNSLFHSRSGGVESVLHAQLGFLHLSLGSSAHADYRNAACQLRQSLLQLLAVEIRGGLLDLLADLGNSGVDVALLAKAVNDDGVLLLNLDGFCVGDYGTAGQDCDILQHLFSSVAVAGSLNRNYVEGASQLVDDQSGQSLALHVLGDDHQSCTGLNDLLQQGQDLLDIGNLLVGNQDIGIV